MGYVPESQRTTVWYLFNKLFKVRANTHRIRTIEEIQTYGTPTTGIAEVDRELEKLETVIMISIAQMEDLYNRGDSFRIVDRADTEKIYKYIMDHLVTMRNFFNGSEHVKTDEKTMDELVRLDRFAAEMFGTARYFMKEEIQLSSLGRVFASSRPSGLAKLRQAKLHRAQQVANGDDAPAAGRRDYRTGDEIERARGPVEHDLTQPGFEPAPEDPSLPKHKSLEKLFEESKRFGLRYN